MQLQKIKNIIIETILRLDKDSSFIFVGVDKSKNKTVFASSGSLEELSFLAGANMAEHLPEMSPKQENRLKLLFIKGLQWRESRDEA